MRSIECHGTPYEIGHTHGSQAADLIAGSIAFYANLFRTSSAKSWDEVKQIAAVFHASILAKWPRFAEEMRGIATGAGVSILDIVALNVRTEIAFGLHETTTGTAPLSDGCTSVYYRFPSDDAGTGLQALQGQNWDWQREQAAHLVYLTIHAPVNEQTVPELPSIKMVTEAGIIGKIGINSHGVGVCFNAIIVPGVDYDGLPAHLALRLALEAPDEKSARQKILQASGGGQMASCAFILIGCADGAVGCEFVRAAAGGVNGCVWQPLESLKAPGHGEMLAHTNHCLLPHPQGAKEQALADSAGRVHRIRELVQQHAAPMARTAFASFFEDETNFPCSINRKQEGESGIESLFNIVMEFHGAQKEARANIRVGRPTEVMEEFEMSF